MKFLSHPRVETNISHTAKNRKCAVSLLRKALSTDLDVTFGLSSVWRGDFVSMTWISYLLYQLSCSVRKQYTHCTKLNVIQTIKINLLLCKKPKNKQQQQSTHTHTKHKPLSYLTTIDIPHIIRIVCSQEVCLSCTKSWQSDYGSKKLKFQVQQTW